MRSIHILSRLNRSAVLAGMALLTLAFVTAVASPADPTKTATGQITSIDVGAKTVGVKIAPKPGDDPMELRLIVDEQTKILKDNRPIVLPDVKVGDDVVVVYRASEGKNVAVSIGVQER